jgi:hypothetical protein
MYPVTLSIGSMTESSGVRLGRDGSKAAGDGLPGREQTGDHGSVGFVLHDSGAELKMRLYSLGTTLTAIPKRGKTPRGAFLGRRVCRRALRRRSR